MAITELIPDCYVRDFIKSRKAIRVKFIQNNLGISVIVQAAWMSDLSYGFYGFPNYQNTSRSYDALNPEEAIEWANKTVEEIKRHFNREMEKINAYYKR